MRAYHHTYGLPVLTTNCSNNYGPYHFPEKLIPLMIVNALAGKPLPVEHALDVAIGVAEGLAYAHEHGVVHRDVKPSNIMILRDGRIKIMDFGIARMRESDIRTQTGMVLGSPRYMSPEQVLGLKIDPRCDIFSLGVML